ERARHICRSGGRITAPDRTVCVPRHGGEGRVASGSRVGTVMVCAAGDEGPEPQNAWSGDGEATTHASARLDVKLVSKAVRDRAPDPGSFVPSEGRRNAGYLQGARRHRHG